MTLSQKYSNLGFVNRKFDVCEKHLTKIQKKTLRQAYAKLKFHLFIANEVLTECVKENDLKDKQIKREVDYQMFIFDNTLDK